MKMRVFQSVKRVKIKKLFKLPNWKSHLPHFIIIILLWALLWSVFVDDALPPNGSIFVLSILFISAILIGRLFAFINGIPPLFGMIIAGFLLKNFTSLNFDPKLSFILRNFSLAIIMLRSGLGLDATVIRRLIEQCFRLAIVPSIVEMLTIAIASSIALKFPFKWGILFGFVMSAVSPAIVVASLLYLQEKKLGNERGIHSLVIAAASIENVIVIASFGVVLNLIFSETGSFFTLNVIQGIGGIAFGIAYGISCGFILWHFPTYDCTGVGISSSQHQRFIILTLVGAFAIFGSANQNITGAGPVGCVAAAFVANIKLKDLNLNQTVEDDMRSLWLICEPFLFGFIGAEMQISYLTENTHVDNLLICFFIGLILRTLIANFILWDTDFNRKEKLFIALSWMPKGTVQAALGPMALAMAEIRNDESEIQYSQQILTIAVISIILTAPIGALIIPLSGSRLLKNDSLINEKHAENDTIDTIDINQNDEINGEKSTDESLVQQNKELNDILINVNFSNKQKSYGSLSV